MLIYGRDFEIHEKQQEDKNIVHTQRELNNVTSYKLKRILTTRIEVYKSTKDRSQQNPNTHHSGRFPEAHNMGSFME